MQLGADRTRRLWVPLACLWLLMLTTFSLPGREGASSIDAMDWVAIVKVGARALGLLGLVVVAAREWHGPMRRRVGRRLLPFALFVAWALASTLWSPLKGFSLGQTLSLTVLFALTGALAILWRRPDDTIAVLRHLLVALLCVSLVLLTANVLSSDLSGLTRSWDEGGSPGLFHPTAAASTASLGLILLVAMRLIWGDALARALLLPGVVIHSAVLLLAISRTALAMTVVVLGALLVTSVSRLRVATVALMLCLAGVVYPLADPGFDRAAEQGTRVMAYLTRGESSETLRSLTGRTELWDAAWTSFLSSPVWGYGYHVISADGDVDALGGPTFRTAHNMLLQVLVSTGVVGAGLFVIGLAVPMGGIVRHLRADDAGRRLWRLSLILGSFYVGWGLLSESFMGALQPESVVFFAAFGVAVGHISASRRPARPAPPREKRGTP